MDPAHVKPDPDAVQLSVKREKQAEVEPTPSSSGESLAPKQEVKQEIKTEADDADEVDGEPKDAAKSRPTKGGTCSEVCSDTVPSEDEGTSPVPFLIVLAFIFARHAW